MTSKRLLRPLALLFAVLVPLGLGQPATPPEQPPLQSYDNPDLGFGIAFPADWQVQEETGEYLSVGPREDSPQAGQILLEVEVAGNYTGTLQEAVTLVLQEFRSRFTSFQELGRRDATVAGLSAQIVDLRVVDEQGNDITMQTVFLVDGTTLYLLYLESLTPVYPDNRPLLEQILASFSPISLVSGLQPPAPCLPSGPIGALEAGQAQQARLCAADERALAFHTYTFEIPAGLSELTVQVDGLGFDLDLAVKAGSEIASYGKDGDLDFLDLSSVPDPSTTIRNPSPATLFIDVINAQSSEAPYRITVQTESAAVAEDPLVGRYVSEALTLELERDGERYRGRILFGDQVFPVGAEGTADGLSGTFESGGGSFAFTAALEGDTLTLVTGNASYTLVREAPPAEPVNPLAPRPAPAPDTP